MKAIKGDSGKEVRQKEICTISHNTRVLEGHGKQSNTIESIDLYETCYNVMF